MNDKRLAAMLAKMTAPPARPQRDPEQLVKLARKGYAPALAVLKARAENCPKHRAALDSLVREATGGTAAPAPAPRRESWVASVPPKPAAQAPAEPPLVTCSPCEFKAMSGYDRGLFIASGGKIEPERKTRADFSKLNPSAQMKYIQSGGKLTD